MSKLPKCFCKHAFISLICTVNSWIRYRFVDAIKYSCEKSSFYFECQYVLRISGSFQVSDRRQERWILPGKLVCRIVEQSFQRHVNRELSRKKSYFGQTPLLGSNRLPNFGNCDLRAGVAAPLNRFAVTTYSLQILFPLFR